MDSYPRKAHFDYFRSLQYPYVGVTVDVDVTDPSRKRENGTECILCMECVKNCPKKAL